MGQEEVRGEPELWFSSSRGGHEEQAEEVLFPRRRSSLWFTAREWLWEEAT